MKRILVAILLGLVFGLPLGRYIAHCYIPKARIKAPTRHYPASASFRQAIRDTKLITVLISVEDWGGWGRGTGVLLDQTHVLTCAHVVAEGGNQILVYFYPGYVLAHGNLVYIDRAKDLAILEIDVPVNADKYATFTTAHYDGEPIMAVGNALGGMEWFVNYGIVSGSDERDLYSDNLIMAGDSGGPWIDEQGRIVAISAWGLKIPGGIDGGIAGHTVIDFLAAYVRSRQPIDLEQLFGLRK